MGKKIYLSAAAHERDNPTACPCVCGENVHCIAYMDRLEERLRALGFEVRRGFRLLTGVEAMENRVKDANRWGADLYYVAHTNAGGGRYSLTLCWDDAESRRKAAVIGKYRRFFTPHRVQARPDLWEIRATAMPCLYDELFFHDNPEDCRRFHEGGLAVMAEETCQALCELCGVEYRPAEPEKPVRQPQKGQPVTLDRGRLYLTARGRLCVRRSGTYYLYDGIPVAGRYRVTNRPERVGRQPLWRNVSGWVEL